MKNKTLLFFNFLLFISFQTFFAQNYSVSTFAGSGTAGSTNNSGTSASFTNPTGITIDNTGNFYVADYGNKIIRKITASGDVSTFAGSGETGNTNANGILASFNNPTSVVTDTSGNIYVADTENNVIRKISSSGDVTTFAGDGTNGSTDANGTLASFNKPTGVAIDNTGNIYVADSENNKIRKITPAGDVSTLAGSGASGSDDLVGNLATFAIPTGVAVDSFGNVYVADSEGSKIRKITPAGQVTTFAGNGIFGSDDGIGTAATFGSPYSVAVDSSNNVYVADTNNHKIRKITVLGEVSTIAGNGDQGNADGPGNTATFSYPTGIVVDGNNDIYVADFDNHKIRKITAATPATHLSFDGTNDYVSLSNNTSLQLTQGTIEAWIKAPAGSNTAYHGIAVKQNAYGLFLVNGKLAAFDWRSGQGLMTTTTTITDNNWHHVALSFGAGELKLYVDGNLSLTDTNFDVLNQTQPLLIGAGSVFVNQILSAELDEVRIWNTVLPQSTLQSQMNCELSLPQSNLVSYYKFNQEFDNINNATVTALTDEFNLNNGTLANFSLSGTQSNWKAGSIIYTGVSCPLLSNQDFDLKNNYKIFPNPNMGFFQIETTEDLSVELIDILGKSILKKQISATDNQIDISGVKSGIYILKTLSGFKVEKSIKVIKI